jgi:hypothetical protein
MKISEIKRIIREEFDSLVEAIDDPKLTVKMYADREAREELDALSIAEFEYNPAPNDTVENAIDRALDVAEERAEEDNIKIDYIEFYLTYGNQTGFLGYTEGGEFTPVYSFMNEDLRSALTVGMLALALATTPNKADAQTTTVQQSSVEVLDDRRFSTIDDFYEYVETNINDIYDIAKTKQTLVVRIANEPTLVALAISRDMQLAINKAMTRGSRYNQQGVSVEPSNKRLVRSIDNGYLAVIVFESQ